MRALVTGGAGFIGSNLVDALVERGDQVAVLDDLSTGRREQRRVADRGLSHRREVVFDAAEGCEVVFHLAAQVDVRRSVDDPAHDCAVNVGGTVTVFEAARRAGVRHLVFASTGGAIYGESDVVPTPEDAPERPLAPYGQSKLAAEGYLRLLGELHGVRVTVLRFANVYGPRQDPLGEGGVCAIFCGAAVAGRGATIFGDGEQTRDFVYVGDVVDACLTAADGAGFGPFNIGTGARDDGQRTRHAASASRPPTSRSAPARSAAPASTPSRAAAELGWTPSTSLAGRPGAHALMGARDSFVTRLRLRLRRATWDVRSVAWLSGRPGQTSASTTEWLSMDARFDRIDGELRDSKDELREFRAEMREEFRAVRADMSRLQDRMVQSAFGLAAAQFVTLVTVILTN